MSNATRYVWALFLWLVAGLGAFNFWPLAPGGAAWWLWLGVPGALTLLTLAAVVAVCIIGLFLALTYPTP